MLTKQYVTGRLEESLNQWFGPDKEQAVAILNRLARGTSNNLLTREHVLLIRAIADHFDTVLPMLASPQQALERLAHFAESYRARMALLKTCASNPIFFKTLVLLFDRSGFIHQLLCQHPEIMEEVLFSPLGQVKTVLERQREIALLPQDESFPRWLWLYVKAEQVRIAALELLGNLSIEETAEDLSRLADASLAAVWQKVDPEGRLACIALGKGP